MLIGESLRIEFVTPSLSTGAATNADALPTALLRRNGSTVGAATVTVSNLGTGLYLAEVLLDAAHSWAVGDAYSLEATWTMGGTAGIKATLAQGAISTDLNAVLTAIKGGAWSTETLKAIYDLVGTRLATAGYTAPDNAGINAKLDTIDDLLDTEVAAIKAKTDQLNFIAGDVVATLNGETVSLASTPATAADVWAYASRTLTSVGNVTVTVVGPVATSGDITIVRGDSYQLPERALEWQTSDSSIWPDLTGATIKFSARRGDSFLSVNGAVVTPTGATKKVRVELSATNTNELVVASTPYLFDIQATLSNGHVFTLVRANMYVKPDLTRPT